MAEQLGPSARADAPDRLFVPLSSQPYDWFASGEKRWELRRYGRQYTERHVYPGRLVELRRGYSGDSLWGRIAAVERASGFAALFAAVPFAAVIPIASSLSDATERAAAILGVGADEAAALIAFAVDGIGQQGGFDA